MAGASMKTLGEGSGFDRERPGALHSALLTSIGVPHAFSTRHGGVSAGMFASLNFGNPGELPREERDPPENIRQNWTRLTEAISAGVPGSAPSGREIVEVHQVHGEAVCRVLAGGVTPRDEEGRDIKADAMVTDDPARLIAVRVADCAPVLLASGDGRVVAAVHAGWRGVVGGVVPAAVQEMRAIGVDPAGIVGAIGACIGAEAFEVGEEVAREFQRVFGGATPHVRAGKQPGKMMVDLKGAIREQLVRAGVGAGRIDVLPHCTVREGTDFYSHRREQGRTGRMVGIIGPRPVRAAS
jgi:YfiH family protein